MRCSIKSSVTGVLCAGIATTLSPDEILAAPLSIASPAAVNLSSPLEKVRYHHRHRGDRQRRGRHCPHHRRHCHYNYRSGAAILEAAPEPATGGSYYYDYGYNPYYNSEYPYDSYGYGYPDYSYGYSYGYPVYWGGGFRRHYWGGRHHGWGGGIPQTGGGGLGHGWGGGVPHIGGGGSGHGWGGGVPHIGGGGSGHSWGGDVPHIGGGGSGHGGGFGGHAGFGGGRHH